MQQRHSRPDWSPAQPFVNERHAEVLPIECERQLALVHVQEYPKDTFLFERAPVLDALGVASVPKLPHAVEAVTEVVVAEGVADAELLLQRDADLQLVLRPRVCDDLPVVLPVHERPIRDHRPEQVVCFVEERVAAIT